MRILYIDVDCLRPDHLGCHGYSRPVSPHIDALAGSGIRFDNVYASDVPCLPSRAAMFSGRFGIHTGVVNHGGAGSEPFPEGRERGFNSRLGRTGWMRTLRDLGFHTASFSSFAERHGAHFFHTGFHEVHNPGSRGLELASQIERLAGEWLARNARRDWWFLHLNFWDPHTPYRAALPLPDALAASPTPSWLTEEVRLAHFAGCGPHSAREVTGFDDRPPPGIPWSYPDQPLVMESAQAVRRMFDGYDAGVRQVDEAVGRLVRRLAEAGVLEDTAVLVTSDHGENLGEMNVYGDHHTADQATARVPLIMQWPGLTETRAGRSYRAFHYQLDVAATITELLGGAVPEGWDGISFARTLRADRDEGREDLIISQAAWTCQRAVRFRRREQEEENEYLLLRTYHDGFHGYPEIQLFDIGQDPHQQTDLSIARADVAHEGMARLERWLGRAMVSASHPADPFWTVLHEGGPKHVRGQLPGYLERLRATGRGDCARMLEARHPRG
jgi:choline-sulfatase